MPDIAFTLGEHAARLDGIERQLTDMNGKLDTLVVQKHERAGQERMVKWAVGLGGSSFLGWLLSLLRHA